MADAAPLRCPQCGGEVPLASGERLPRCPFCDATLFVDRGGLVSHYSLPRRLDRERAAAALRRWMAGNETVKDLDRKAEIVAVEAVSFPMWLFRLQAREGERVIVEPAAATPVPQLADLQVPAGKLEPFQAEDDGIDAVPQAVPLATAREWLGQRAPDAVPTENALVRMPLWRGRYRFGGRDYLAYVDASTGVVLAAVFPAKAESPFWFVAILGSVLFLVAGFATANVFYKLALYVVIAVPLFLLAWWVAKRT